MGTNSVFINKCSIFSFTSYSPGILKQHMKLDHSCCSLCNFAYLTSNKRHLRKHFRMHHKDKRLCEWCTYSGEKADVKIHQSSKHPERFQKCSHCDYTATRSERLNLHIKAVHLKQYDLFCEKCDYSCPSKSALIQHDYRHHRPHDPLKIVETKDLKCDNCNTAFVCKYNLKRHKMHVHDKVPRKDNRLTPKKAHLRKQFKIHNKDKHLCEWCNYSGEKADIKNHQLSIHPERLKKCLNCDYTTTRSSWLNLHIKAIHLKKYELFCEKCDYSCSSRSGLIQHDYRHHRSHDPLEMINTINVKCDQCDTSFACEDKLNRGKKYVHNKVTRKDNHPNCLCFTCGKMDGSKADYLCVNLICCKFCSYSSYWKSWVAYHIQSVHDKISEEGANCSFCRKTFSRKYNLNMHVKKEHDKIKSSCSVKFSKN